MSHLTFVLGAGASATVGLPLYKDLLSPAYIQRLEQAQKETTTDVLAEHIRFLTEMVDELNCSGLHFEELLDIAYETDRGAFSALLLFYKTLLLAAEIAHRKRPDLPIAEPYLSFGAVLKMLVGQGHSVCILSFNHDLLVEQCLGWSSFTYGPGGGRVTGIPSACVGIPKGEAVYHAVDPSVPAEAYDFTSPVLAMSAPVPASGANLTTLLKLHGSFNQLACVGCGDIYYAYGRVDAPVVEQRETTICSVCECLVTESIVPPRRVKDLKGLAVTWENARAVLESSDELYFVGYSLPDYDTDAVALFINVNPRCRVSVYNNSSSPDVVAHFRKMFPRADVSPYGFRELVSAFIP